MTNLSDNHYFRCYFCGKIHKRKFPILKDFNGYDVEFKIPQFCICDYQMPCEELTLKELRKLKLALLKG